MENIAAYCLVEVYEINSADAHKSYIFMYTTMITDVLQCRWLYLD